MHTVIVRVELTTFLAYVFVRTRQVPPFMIVCIGISIAAFTIFAVGSYWMRSKHLREWPSANGRIESCSLGRLDEGTQTYYCLYMFSVDDARQAGELQIWDKPNRLEEVKAALVGKAVTVRYDPNDCTKSIIEETQVDGWSLRS